MTFHPLRDYYYIAINCDSSRLNAYLCCMQPHQNVEIKDEATFSNIPKDDQEPAKLFLTVTQKWREEYGLLPVIIGGKGGIASWKTTPYVSCPVVPIDIVGAQVSFKYQEQSIHLLPSLKCQHENGRFDILHGQEIQVLGWLHASATHRNGTFLICLPAEHTQWILVNDGTIKVFKTAITGELSNLLLQSSMFTQMITDAFDDTAFQLGTKRTSRKTSTSLLHELFSVYTSQLLENFSPIQAHSYLKGLLIGSDVHDAMQAPEWDFNKISEVIIIGECQMTDLYAQVIRTQTACVRCFHGKQATVLGFASVRQRHLSLNHS